MTVTKPLLRIIICVSGLFSPLFGMAQTTGGGDFQQQLQGLEQSMQQRGAPASTTNAATSQVASGNSTVVLPPPTGQIQAQSAAPAAASSPTNALVMPSQNNTALSPEPVAQSAGTTAGAATAPADEIDVRDEAFSRMTNNILPLSPAQIELLRSLYDATQRAAAVYPGVPPRPTSTSIAVNLSPGATPPIIRLGAGFVTSLVFVDASGSPWPIESYSLGNPNAFNIQWDKKSNILLIQAIAAHRVGNLAVILRGLNTPVMIDLSPGQAAMDVRVDLRIPRLGPDAKPSSYGSGLPGTESPYLLNLLDGIPPPGAKVLTASGCDNCVWLLDGKLYFRTQYTMISPGWISTLSSADGTHVYELQPTPMILATYEGKMIKLRIEGF